MLRERTDLIVYLATLTASIGAVVKFIPLFLLGIVMLADKYKSAFNPSSKDSIYRPEVQRTTAYFLLALALAEGFTGFGAGPQTSSIITAMTFGLLTRGTSLTLHLILIAPLDFFFILHATSGLGSMLIRRGVRNPVVYNYVIPIIMLVLFSFAFYLDTLFF